MSPCSNQEAAQAQKNLFSAIAQAIMALRWLAQRPSLSRRRLRKANEAILPVPVPV